MSPRIRFWIQSFCSFILIFSLPIAAQTAATRHFALDGVAFDYPAELTLTDRSTPQAQHLTITRPATSVLIMVIAYRDPIVSRDQLVAATKEITEPYINSLIEKLGTRKSPAKRDSVCGTIGDTSLGGIEVRGEMNGAPVTADIFAFPKGRRFTNLIYIRKDAEEPAGAAA